MTKKPPPYRPCIEPLREMPAGFAKCSMCGRTLPVERMEPGLPKAWTACRGCWAENQRLDPYRNPLGPSPTKEDVANHAGD